MSDTFRYNSFTPVIRDDGLLAGSCERQCGGARLPSVGARALSVENITDSATSPIWTDEDFTPHTDEDNGVLLLDNVA